MILAVTTVDSGTKALKLLGLNEDHVENDENLPSVSPNNHNQDLEVNLVITDYCMPGMTGYDLLRKIKVSSISFFIFYRLFLFMLL